MPTLKPVTVVMVVPVVTDTPEVLVQLPPAVKSLKVTEDPLHTEVAPPIPEGTGLTVTTTIVGTPATVYEIDAVPAATPVTTPDVPTVATNVLPLCHVPPDVASVNAVVDPIHTLSVPPIPPTPEGFTVTIIVADAAPQLLVTV